MTLLTLATSVALKLLPRVAAVAAEKLRIVEESFSGPRLASATARRHGISNQLLLAWRKAYREGQLGDIRGFVPAISFRSSLKKAADLAVVESRL